MATVQCRGVRLAGLAAAVPSEVQPNTALAERFGEEQVEKICQSTGIRNRPVASRSVCSSDLCFAAADKLLVELDWERESIGGLVFVSQTPDHILPATSSLLHQRLGLSKTCAALDVNMGCSGYVYGLWLASQMAASLGQRVLLLVGDTINKLVAPEDRATALLFGDAGSASAIEPDSSAEPWTFTLGADGSGAEHIRVCGAGFRRENSESSVDSIEDVRLELNGPEVFAFTLREVPKMIAEVLQASDWKLEDADAVVMHQANEFMLRHLGKSLGVTAEQLILTLAHYGNTSCASIPLAIAHAMSGDLQVSTRRLLLAGFGVGWSWGAATVTCGPMVIPPVISVPSAESVATA